jgi:hypothetical protein
MSQATPVRPYLRRETEGDTLWFLGNLVTFKATGAETRGRLTVAEFVNPAGFSPPLHRHLDEDEMFYLLSGRIRAFRSRRRGTRPPAAAPRPCPGRSRRPRPRSRAARLRTARPSPTALTHDRQPPAPSKRPRRHSRPSQTVPASMTITKSGWSISPIQRVTSAR